MQITPGDGRDREFATDAAVVHLEPPGARTVTLPSGHHVLDICLGGSMSEARLDGREIEARPCPPNSWRLVGAGTARTLRTDRSGSTLRLEFRPEALVDEAAREAARRAAPGHRFDDALIGIATTLAEHLVRHAPGPHLPADDPAMRFADDAVRLILGRTAQCLDHPDDAEEGSPVARALRFVDAHLDGELTLARVASHVGLSQYHFARLFRRETHTSLRRHVIAQRIDRARALLLRTDESLADIAYRVGFGSQSHMTTLFRKHLGRTPARLRRARCAPLDPCAGDPAQDSETRDAP